MSMTYSLETSCRNCYWKGDRRIPHGIEIALFLPDALCPCCGCKTLETPPHIGRYDINPDVK